MTPYEIIIKKRNGFALSQAEIKYMISGFTNGIIPAYQMSAFLMAVYFKGLDINEIFYFTKTLLHSGKILNLSNIGRPVIDKHSTGGVGDKISLILSPLAASAGIIVPMISGRGLGHTGGTVDKMESIPGFNTQISGRRLKKQLKQIGAAMIGQTPELAPADNKIYALRDVTATVESIPLISASIMGKKLAEGIDGMVLDVKTGNGAFTKNIEDAVKLAKLIISIGSKMGKKVTALITDMNQPLGYAIGNALEVKESIDVLQGRGPKDVREISLALAEYMLKLAGKKNPRQIAQKLLDTGTAYRKFIQIVKAQGGDISRLPEAKLKAPVLAPRSGYITGIDTLELGLCSTYLGAGRITIDSVIDPSAGIMLMSKIGNRVKKGEPLAVLHANKPAQAVKKRVEKAFKIGSKKSAPLPLIYKVYGSK